VLNCRCLPLLLAFFFFLTSAWFYTLGRGFVFPCALIGSWSVIFFFSTFILLIIFQCWGSILGPCTC
jgi:hypothetical protein